MLPGAAGVEPTVGRKHVVSPWETQAPLARGFLLGTVVEGVDGLENRRWCIGPATIRALPDGWKSRRNRQVHGSPGLLSGRLPFEATAYPSALKAPEIAVIQLLDGRLAEGVVSRN